MEIHALRERGWKISAIARHVGRDRKTVRSYLAGVRTSSAPDALAPFEEYVRARFVDDHTIWLTALFDEVVELAAELEHADTLIPEQKARIDTLEHQVRLLQVLLDTRGAAA